MIFAELCNAKKVIRGQREVNKVVQVPPTRDDHLGLDIDWLNIRK